MYFVKRILFLIPLLLVISFLAFVLVRAVPGGPFDRERKPASPEIERNLRAKYHLDEPVWQQYFRYLDGILHGDFGPSLKYRNHSVSDIIAQGLPVSLTLGAVGVLLRAGRGDSAGFFTAGAARALAGLRREFLARCWSICVPGLVIGADSHHVFCHQTALVSRRPLGVALARRSAHAHPRPLFFRARRPPHARRDARHPPVPNSSPPPAPRAWAKSPCCSNTPSPSPCCPVLSYSGPMLADLLTGSFIVENLFQIPGIGVFMVNSSLDRDYTMVRRPGFALCRAFAGVESGG